MVSSPRRFSLLGLGVVLVAWLCVVGLGRRPAADFRARARAATIALDSIAGHAPDSVRALAQAYVERARLGMGSPFRLIDQAVHDPRFDDSTRRTVAWSIVDRLLEGTSYEIDAAVLDGAGPAGAGAGHLALIDSQMARTTEPWITERVVRLAYSIAASSGVVNASAFPVIVEVAAQRRDRALAERDLRGAIDRVSRSGGDLIDELLASRDSHTLEVERPSLAARLGDAGLDEVQPLIERIGVLVADSAALTIGNRSLLPATLAPVLGRLAVRRPPQPAVTLSLKSSSPLLRGDATLLPSVRRYLASSANEESFVAAYAIANRFSDRQSVAANRAALSAAVSLRTLAQEPVWFPGMPGPTPGEVIGRFGLKTIDFAGDIPASWRPYYARMTAEAIEDLQRVLPGYEPTGLAIHFVTRALPDSALAMHDPRSHALVLSIGTAPGALAHELAHDLDWQSARRLFARGGGYATDRSARELSGQLGASVRWLAAGRTSAGRVATASSRPAEVFARSVDWFISQGLAEIGRSNGNLSSIQDPLLPGFAAALTDAASLSAADALASGLAEMTPVPDSIRARYLDRWSESGSLDPVVAIARLRAAPLLRRGSRLTQSIGSPLQAAYSSCAMGRLRNGTARERLFALAIEARARGVVLRRAAAFPEDSRPAWARAALGEPTWSRDAYEEMVQRSYDLIVEGAGRAGIGIAPAPLSGC